MIKVVDHAQIAPTISVVICTRDRAELLRRAINSVVIQALARSDCQLIVVDNGSTDHTAEVVRNFEAHGNVYYLFEPEVGLCVARNAGWKAAVGRYIAYLDDDAIASPGWLDAIGNGFKTAMEAPMPVGVIGGRVSPIWEHARPHWLADEIAGSLTIIDWGANTKVLSDLRREWLVGANLAVPRSILEEVGGFHPWLDRVDGHLLSSGDVFLQMEIVRRGYCCLYVPEMAISHLAAKSRLNKGWFMRRFFWQGTSDAIIQLIERTPAPSERLRMAAARAIRLLRSPSTLAALLWRTGDDRIRFKNKCLALIDVGFIAGLLGVARR